MFLAFETHTRKKFPWPLDRDVLRGFAVFCLSVKNLKPSSVKTYMSSLVCLHKLKGFTEYEVKDSMVEAILRGAENLSMAAPVPPRNTRRVMTLPLLRHLGHRLKKSGWCKTTQQTIWTAATVAFFGSTHGGDSGSS